jgi:hypothetical protein
MAILRSFDLEALMLMPNNLPEPPPIMDSVPHSRLTDWAARLSF